MSLDKVLAELKKGVVAPCYLLYGEEEYLINETLRQILDLIIPQSDRDFGLFFLDGENTDIDSMIEYALTPSLLGGRKVIVVRNTTIFQSRENLSDLIQKILRNIDENPTKAAKYFLTFLKLTGFSLEDLQGTGWKKITDEQWRQVVKSDSGEDRDKWLPRVLDICTGIGFSATVVVDKLERLEELLQKGPPSGNCLMFTAEAVDKRKKIYKTIAETGIVLYFGIPRGDAAQKEALRHEAQKLLAQYSKKVTPDAWIALGKKTAFELRGSLMELGKLISFVGERSTIDQKDVEEVVGKTKEDSIFDLTTALSEKNQLAALNALRALLDQGIHHLMVLTMIVREIRFLLQARIMVNSEKLPKLNAGMDYGWFQKNVQPVVTNLLADISRRDGLLLSQHPFVIYNALKNCSRFSYDVLLLLLDELLEIDHSFKSSAKDPQLLLENFLIKACAKGLQLNS
jgi:DNA polymerase-3 subunit delta